MNLINQVSKFFYPSRQIERELIVSLPFPEFEIMSLFEEFTIKEVHSVKETSEAYKINSERIKYNTVIQKIELFNLKIVSVNKNKNHSSLSLRNDKIYLLKQCTKNHIELQKIVSNKDKMDAIVAKIAYQIAPFQEINLRRGGRTAINLEQYTTIMTGAINSYLPITSRKTCLLPPLIIAASAVSECNQIIERGIERCSLLSSYSGYYDDPELLNFFIINGVDLNTQFADKKTPLHKAAQFNNMTALNILLDANVDINAKDNHGNTPLHYACGYVPTEEQWLHCDRFKINEMVSILLAHPSINVDIKNNYNLNALELTALFYKRIKKKEYEDQRYKHIILDLIEANIGLVYRKMFPIFLDKNITEYFLHKYYPQKYRRLAANYLKINA